MLRLACASGLLRWLDVDLNDTHEYFAHENLRWMFVDRGRYGTCCNGCGLYVRLYAKGMVVDEIILMCNWMLLTE